MRTAFGFTTIEAHKQSECRQANLHDPAKRMHYIKARTQYIKHMNDAPIMLASLGEFNAVEYLFV